MAGTAPRIANIESLISTVALISYSATASSTLVSNTTGVSTQCPLDTVDQPASFSSLASNRVTLTPSGIYMIDWDMGLWNTGVGALYSSSYIKIFNGAILKYSDQVKLSTPSGNFTPGKLIGHHILTIVAPTVLELYQVTIATGANNSYIGETYASPYAIKAQLKIQKIG